MQEDTTSNITSSIDLPRSTSTSSSPSSLKPTLHARKHSPTHIHCMFVACINLPQPHKIPEYPTSNPDNHPHTLCDQRSWSTENVQRITLSDSQALCTVLSQTL